MDSLYSFYASARHNVGTLLCTDFSSSKIENVKEPFSYYHVSNQLFSWSLFILSSFFKTLGWAIKVAAAAPARSLQSCPTLWDPIDSSPPGSAVPGILHARTLRWVAISFSTAWKWKVKVNLLSRVQLFTTPWTAAYQAPLSVGFSRQEYWSGLPLPSPNKDNMLYYHNHLPCGFRETTSKFEREMVSWLAYSDSMNTHIMVESDSPTLYQLAEW